MSKEPRKSGNGKGGNWDIQRNPFLRDDVPPRAPLTDAPALLAAIEAAIGAGCAVMVGATRDRGATVLTILDGDERPRTYCHSAKELEDAAQSLMQMYS